MDFTEATGTSLNTEFLDKALEHCDDQGLRSMLVHGFVSGFDAELQIVVPPHLLSLALGVAFSDDFKDFFNQLYLHPSQRWLSTLIWLQLGANGPAYSQMMELCLGFGCNVSSTYAQRFAHELVRLFCLRFDAEEKAIFNAETDPSQRAWLDARRKLDKIIGNNEARLYSLMCYTDDPHGMCVGIDRLVRMLRC